MNQLKRFYLVFALALFSSLGATSGEQTLPRNPDFIGVDQVQSGTMATGYTVLSSEQGIEPFDAKIIGVMRNFIGPHEDLVVAELSSPLFKRSGVVSGMSGSPVYVGKRLLGAIGYGLGEFTDTPIVGITPIKSMLNYAGRVGSAFNPASKGKIKPIALSLVGKGLSPESLDIFKETLAQKGYSELSLATQSLGKSKANATELFAGGPVAAVIVDGDLSIAAIGTVTYIKGKDFVAFGHPFMQGGNSQFAAATAEILTTVFSQKTSSKLGQPLKLVGSITSDRAAGIGGHIGETPAMVPVTVDIDGKKNRFTVAPLLKDFPLYVSLTLVNSLLLRPARNLGGSLEATAVIKISDGRELTLRHRVSAQAAPLEGELAKNFMDELEYLTDQPFARTQIDSIVFNIRSSDEVKKDILYDVLTPASARQDQSALFRVQLQPWQKQSRSKSLSLKIPRGIPPGDYQITIADRPNALRIESESGLFGHPASFDMVFKQLQSLPNDHELCFYLQKSGMSSELTGFSRQNIPLSLKKLSANFAVDDVVRHSKEAIRLGCQAMDNLTVGVVSGSLKVLPAKERISK